MPGKKVCYKGESDKFGRFFVPVIITPVGFWEKPSQYPKIVPLLCKAQIDTGATISGVPDKIIKRLNLTKHIDTRKITDANSTKDKDVYSIDLYIMNSKKPLLGGQGKFFDMQYFSTVLAAHFGKPRDNFFLLDSSIIIKSEFSNNKRKFTYCSNNRHITDHKKAQILESINKTYKRK